MKVVKKRKDYKMYEPAVSELYNALEVVQTNAPINEKRGDISQARLERKNAESFKSAIQLLTA